MKNEKSKHTPEPWTAHEYAKNSLGYKNGKAHFITSDDGTPAFQVLKSETFDHRNGKTGRFWDPSAKAKDEANARLIAAAPDLLAALELALTTLSSVACNESDEIDNVKTEIANAINKAKGE